MPARQTVFDLSIGSLILIENRNADSVVGQYFRCNRTCNGCANDGDEVLSVISIDEGSLSEGASIGRQAGPSLIK